MKQEGMSLEKDTVSYRCFSRGAWAWEGAVTGV